jgi:SAM-dependent methyltransferase
MNKGGLRDKKLLEYFVSLELLDVQKTDVVIDVASEWSIFPEVLRKLTGAVVYQQDLIYPPGIHDYRIGGNAALMPLPDNFADKLVLHNAYEHFEGNADTEFIIEAWRVLKPGGVLCILPLYVAEKYHILTDPLVNRRGIVWDEGAQIVERPWWHNRFGRFYDPKSLDRRVLTTAKNIGFQATIYHVTNIKEVLDQSEMHFALIMRKSL